jgi:PAS domain S-box-containing protein
MAEDGTLLGVGGIAVDITERKQAERALAASERRLALALQATNDGLWDWDLTTDTAFFSERYKGILGYGPEEFPDCYGEFRSRVHPDDLRRVEAVIAELHAGTRDRFEEEFRMHHKDGHFVDVVSRGYLVRDDTSKAVRLTGTHTDVTELRAVQAQLAQAYKLRAVGQLAGGTAHDFNNLLQVIQSSIELVRRKIQPGHDVHSFLDSALQATQRGGRLTQQLLSFSRKQLLRPETIHPAILIRGMLDLIRRTIGEDIEIRTEIEEDLPTVTLDPHGMENAILNIVLNSRAAMPNGGMLTVRAGRKHLARELVTADGTLPPGTYVEIAIIDTGYGMPADIVEHAFEPFFTTKEIGQGSGLGLSMVFGFARQSGGHVTLESAVGRGTTVTFLLPAAKC